MLGPRSMGAGAYAADNRPGASSSSSYHPVTHFGALDRNDHNDNRRPTLTPAQRLIERYERMSTPPPQTPPPPMRNKSTKRQQYVYDYTASSQGMHHSDRYMDSKEKKGFKGGRSPIRQSLRNLLSVVKKGAGGLAKRKSDGKLALPVGALGRSSKEEERASEPVTQDNGTLAQVGPSTAHSRKKMTGPLFYLTRGAQLVAPDVPGPLMWTACSVTLDSNKLVVSSFTSEMELYVHEVSLLRCSDIRSVSASQLSEAEAALLEGMPDGDKMRIFEILFEGREREKFAAKSVRERAGWISAIWDGILPMKETTKITIPQDEANDSVVIAPHNSGNDRIPVESPTPVPLPQMSSLLNPSYSDRSLPPLPPKSPSPAVAPLSIPENKNRNTQRLHLDLSEFRNPISPSLYPPTFRTPGSSVTSPPVYAKPDNLRINTGALTSPSIYPPTSRPASVFVGSPLASTPSSSGPNSPSIANLSQLSVVRQRLAQIERNHSELSAQSSSRPTTRTSTPTPSPVSASSRWSKREAVFHNTGTRSARSSQKAASPISSIFDDRESPACRSNESIEARRRAGDVGSSSEDPRTKKRSERTDKVSYFPSQPRSEPSKDDLRKLSKDIATVKGVLGGESGYPTIHQMVAGIEHRIKGDKKALLGIQDALKVLGDRVGDVASAAASSSDDDKTAKTVDSIAQQQGDDIMRALREVKDKLSTAFPALDNKLQERQPSDKNSLHAMPVSDDKQTQCVADLQPLLDRLEEIRKFCDILAKRGGKEDVVDAKPSEHIKKILSLIQEDSNKQTLLAQQQADSVRYLNELNTWLEAFVNNGTSQIQGISANIDRLCKEIGQDGSQPNLVNDIRQLIAGMKARDQNFAALQAAVHSLLEVLAASQTQRGADSQAIAGLMDRQRHDQEVLFRAFTNEISGEIKGERLRFVEAMKEATAINVQIHVEQFKQELSREVMTMTEEVGRLHREKQTIENQISDLFSFYSKHKQSDMPLHTIQENVAIQGRQVHGQSGTRANIPRSHQRLLPYPH